MVNTVCIEGDSHHLAVFVQLRPGGKRDVLHFRESYLCMEKERCAGTRMHVHVCL